MQIFAREIDRVAFYLSKIPLKMLINPVNHLLKDLTLISHYFNSFMFSFPIKNYVKLNWCWLNTMKTMANVCTKIPIIFSWFGDFFDFYWISSLLNDAEKNTFNINEFLCVWDDKQNFLWGLLRINWIIEGD